MFRFTYLFNFILLVQLLSDCIITNAQNVKDVPYLVLFARKTLNPFENYMISMYGTGILVSPYDVLTTSAWLLTLDSASASSYFEAYAAADSPRLTQDKGHAIQKMTFYPGFERENHVLLSPLNAAIIRLKDKFDSTDSKPIEISKPEEKYYKPGAKVQTRSFKTLHNRSEPILRSASYTIINFERCKELLTTKYYSTGTGYLTRAQVCAEADQKATHTFDHSDVGGAVLAGKQLIGVLLAGGNRVFEKNDNLVVFLRMDYIYDFVREYVSQYQRCPSPESMEKAKAQIANFEKEADRYNQEKSDWEGWLNEFNDNCG